MYGTNARLNATVAMTHHTTPHQGFECVEGHPEPHPRGVQRQAQRLQEEGHGVDVLVCVLGVCAMFACERVRAPV